MENTIRDARANGTKEASFLKQALFLAHNYAILKFYNGSEVPEELKLAADEISDIEADDVGVFNESEIEILPEFNAIVNPKRLVYLSFDLDTGEIEHEYTFQISKTRIFDYYFKTYSEIATAKKFRELFETALEHDPLMEDDRHYGWRFLPEQVKTLFINQLFIKLLGVYLNGRSWASL